MHCPEEARERLFDPSPAAVVQSVRIGANRLFVVRDDLLPGGTKQRGLHGLLRGYRAAGIRRVVYASPFCGYAQIALAFLCAELRLECVLFCETDPATAAASRYSCEAAALGARVHLSRSLRDATADSEDFCRNHRGYHAIPLGFDCPEFDEHYTRALLIEWERLLIRLPAAPKVLWLPVGSGTLARNFHRVLRGRETRIHAVDVHVLPPRDHRLRALAEADHFRMYSAEEVFRETCRDPLGLFPANDYYDAKLGPFLRAKAGEGDVVWNVAR